MNNFWPTIDNLSEADILRMIGAGVTESRDLEFKKDTSSPSHKEKFLKTVCAFANSAGGDLIYGIEATDGRPVRPCPLAKFNPDQTKIGLRDWILASVQPRVFGVQFHEVELAGGGYVFIVRVPKTWSGPHMLRDDNRFWIRDGGGNRPMEFSDVSAAFSESGLVGERLKSFRQGRIADIMADATPIQLLKGAKLVLHLVPLESLTGPAKMAPAQLYGKARGALHSLGVSGGEKRLDFDGIFDFDCREVDSRHYAYLFRNGIVEGVEAKELHQDYQGKILLPMGYYEPLIAAWIKDHLALLRQLDFQPPIAFCLTLLNVKGFMMQSSGYASPLGNPISRDHLFVPESVLEDWGSPIDDLVRAPFDAVWNACGLPGSPSYSKDTQP